MDKRVNIKMVIMVLVVAMMAGLPVEPVIGADETTGIPAIHDAARPVEISGPVMEVDYNDSSIIIYEQAYKVGKFMVNDKVLITQLVDGKGQKVGLDQIKSDQWVVVNGYRVGRSDIFATKVEVVDEQLKKDNRAIKIVAPATQ